LGDHLVGWDFFHDLVAVRRGRGGEGREVRGGGLACVGRWDGDGWVGGETYKVGWSTMTACGSTKAKEKKTISRRFVSYRNP
jgi:hypothetical protein